MNLNQELGHALRPLIQSIALPVAAFLRLWALGALTKQWICRRRRHLQLVKAVISREEKPHVEPLYGFDWKSSERRQLRPFKPTYHITMAIKADTPSELITIDQDYLDRINIRRELIAQHGSTVHGCIPEGDAAVREVYTNLVTGMSFPTTPMANAEATLRVLGETVEEDLFLLQKYPEGHRSIAFICCFPAGFDPSAKLGKTLQEIHAPVPSYGRIGASMERFFRKLEVGKGVKRTNWSVQTHTELFNSKGNHISGDDTYEDDQEVDIENV
ncbi:hypothetical protein Neosp_001563 [[Neocosmospora] mangrovei]